MKKYLFRILIVMLGIWAAIGNIGCKNEYKDMLPGEIRLKENDYRNDDKIKDTEYSTDKGAVKMSAMEVRGIWHAVIIKTEDEFERTDDKEGKLYESPVHAEETFHSLLRENMNSVAEKYPYSHTAIMKELARAEVHTYIKYVWCAQAEEYVNLKFEATPHIIVTEVPAEQKTGGQETK